MGFRDLVLFYVVTGISLRWIATAASAGPSSIVIWIIAWLAFFMPLALSVIELSSRYPDEGGLYVWSKRAFGDFAGFMSAWTYWTSNLPYFPGVLYFAAANALYVGGERWRGLSSSSSYFIIFSLLGLALPTFLNIVGLNLGKWLNNAGAFGMWLPVLLVIVMGIISWLRLGPATSFTGASLVPSTNLKDIIFWSTIIFALGGCETASFMGEEILDARRNIPRALLLGGVVVTITYTVGTICVLLALPKSEVSGLQGLMEVVVKTGQRIGFTAIIPVAALLITLSNVGAAGAFLAATARLPFVAGIDRFLPAAFGNLHPRWRTPHVAILTQGLCGAVFIFLGQAGTSVKGAYDVLVSMGVITYMIPYLFVFAAMMRLQREPAGPEVFRVPGGRPVGFGIALLGLATTTIAILLSFVPPSDEPRKGLAVAKVVGLSALLVGFGAGIYGAGKRSAGLQPGKTPSV